MRLIVLRPQYSQHSCKRWQSELLRSEMSKCTLPSPFFVIATQNPMLYEWTYPLSEAQTDRFLCAVSVWYWTVDHEIEILWRHWWVSLPRPTPTDTPTPHLTPQDCQAVQQEIDKIYTHPTLIEYIARCVDASRNPDQYELQDWSSYINQWLSSRAWIGLLRCAKVYAWREWRWYVLPEDVKQCMMRVCAHRIRLSYAAVWSSISAQQFIHDLIETVPLSGGIHYA